MRMFKSNLFLKVLGVVVSIIIIYALSISFFIMPKIDSAIQKLEEKNAIGILDKIVTLAKNVSTDLKSFKQHSLELHKKELQDLTDSVWSIVKTKYEQSKPQNYHIELKKRGELFRKNLINFYQKNKNKMSTRELKQAIINYTKIYRYNGLNTAYFWINDLNAKMILEPMNSKLNGKKLWNYKDSDGIYVFRNFAQICRTEGSGFLTYKWKNPETGKEETKISYVFLFKPFGWIFGTGEFYSVLEKKFKQEAINLVKDIRYDDNNYFFIVDYKYKLIAHPYLIGRDMSYVKDIKGELIIPPMVDIARQKGSGFITYWWKKNKTDDTPYQKLTYVRDFPYWKMVLGTGVYLDDIEKEVANKKIQLMKQIRKIVIKTKIGTNGYMYIFDGSGNMIIHPDSRLLTKNIKKLKNPATNGYIFDDLIKAAKTQKPLYYKWNRPDDKNHFIYDKVSWVRYIPELDWYICASAYVDDFKSSSKEIKNFMIMISILLLLISGIYSYILLGNILKPITKLKELVLEVKKGNYSIRSDIQRDDEIGVLAREFNQMIDTIEDNIKNLDNRVKSRTAELEKQKQYINSIINSQDNIVLTSDGYNIKTANKSFFEFYEINTLQEFESRYGENIGDTFEQKEGYLSKEIEGKKWIDYVLEYPQKIHKVVIKKDDDEYIFTLKAHNFEFQGETLITIVLTNITEIEKIKQELEHQKRYLKAIMDSQDNIVITSDETDIKTANRAFFDFYEVKTIDEFKEKYGENISDTFEKREGYIYKEIEGKKWIDYVLEYPQRTHKAVIKKGKNEYIFTLKAHKFEFEGETLITTVFTNITELEKIKNELELAKIKAEESTKSKSAFLANMSHEIRTPMNGIIGMAHLVLQTKLTEKQRNYIEKIDNSAKSLLGIINDILDFSKIEAGKLNLEKIDFDLFKTIESVTNVLEFKAHDKGLEFIVDYDINLGKKFYGDPLRVSQIVTNLLTNAIKFTDEGRVSLRILKVNDKRVRFEVCDTGIGLTEEQQKNLFKSFTQADTSTTRKYGGTGLGLVISKQLVEKMNGKIWVESVYGVGSCFKFEIELIKKPDDEVYTIFEGKRALVVDDSQSWREILHHLLYKFGFEVESVKDGEDAIALVERNDYDVVLMDWNMPKMDGIETAKIIKSYKNVPIILVSAFNNDSLQQKAKAENIPYFIPKPVDPSVLNDTLSDILIGTKKLEERKETKIENSLKEDITTLKGSRILLVEDNKTNQEIILGLLEDSGIIIDIANNGKEAIDKFKRNKYELILMDLQMPIMDGYEATKIIRNLDKNVPIVALTANAMKEDIEKTKQIGMNKHLNKPINVDELYKTLLQFLSKKVEKTTLKEQVKEKLPDFKYIDKEYALKLLMGNEKIFKNILKGLYEYKAIKLDEMDDEEFQRVIHTIKGISGSAGAKKLFEISSKINETLDKSLLPLFYEELNKVIEDIEKSGILKEKQKDKIDEKKKIEILNELKEALKTKRPKNVNLVLEEMENYEFDDEKLAKVKELAKKFKFKEALEIL